MTWTTCSTVSSPTRCVAFRCRLARVRNDGLQSREWAPLADVSENDGEYVIKAELPEVRKDDVNVTVQDGVLTLSGERKQEEREENENVHRIERFYGSFCAPLRAAGERRRAGHPRRMP